MQSEYFRNSMAMLLAILASLLTGTASAAAGDHVYYVDADQDSYGDPNNTLTLPIDWLPNRLLTHRAGDPDDHNGWIFPVVTPKGSRRFGLELIDGPDDGSWPLRLYNELGADAVSAELRWDRIETTPGSFNGADVAALPAVAQQLPQLNLAVSLSVSVISGTQLALPADLRDRINAGTLRISDPVVIARFNTMLDHIHGIISGVPLVSLQLGHEVDRMFALRPDLAFWVDFQVFYYSVANHAKSLWGSDLKVGLTATHLGLTTEPQRGLMRYLNSTSDIVAMTYFPAGYDYLVQDPSTLDIAGTFAQIKADYGSKGIFVQATGYPSAAQVGGSQMKQSQFLYRFFDAWDKHAASIPYVSFYRMHDPSAAMVQATLATQAVNSQNIAAATENVVSLGLRQRAGAGTSKTAYGSLRNLAFERGWWREETRTSRPYHMGFTPELFDFSNNPAEVATVEQYVVNKLATDGDMVNLHMDGGIPWPEAFADNFSSAALPYSTELQATWYALRNRVPAGNKLLVSINPLGIPRSRLAPYWGYGEHFQYQQGPPWGRVPTGDFSDGAPRMPPAPWGTYTFDDPQVTTAFINYARRVVEFFKPDYLMIGIEVSATQVEDEAAWQSYLRMHKTVYTALKQRYPNLPIMVSFSGTSYMTDELFPLVPDRTKENGHAWKYDEMNAGVRERLKQGMRDILPYTDIIALSVYPHFGKYNAYQMPATMWDQLFALLHEIGADDKPIGISESGFSADPFSITISDQYIPFVFAGDPQKQERFLKLMFYELNKTTHPVEFVISYQVRDGDQWWQRLFSSGQDIFNQFYQYFRDIGIYAGDGSVRLGTVRWRNEFKLPLVPR